MKLAKSSQEKAAWSVKQAEAYKGFSLGYNYTLVRTDQAPSWYNNTTDMYPYGSHPITHTIILISRLGSTIYNAYDHQLKLQLPIYNGRQNREYY